ncbi:MULTISPECIES: sensor histidine kinase [unclassified Corynebacterium]|uniref:sensor histidine kinase n=1 Tax=unclassified Corynebacterium TaxID=2624378 RepID=UPI0029C9B599|nr:MULTISPECIES: histidine kinase [unclassified Corynebacterium]WPF65515.1 histidine kinase [Corynebacterium sp. 22KM0430]WPF68011.1 histidine kinase [Corynebacterium sp. 21KM1197]
MPWCWGRRAKRPRAEGSHEERQAAKIAELTASRRAIADAYEVERQRIERDLHDGTQQYLVAAAIKLGEATLDARGETLNLVRAAKADLDAGLASLRATVRGIHPQVLSDFGLSAAVRDIAANYGPHVSVHTPHELPDLSPSVVAAGYFFVAEALTNAAKHAPGAQVSVLLASDAHLRISVVDQGPGGASVHEGHGLAGMRERLAAFGGTLTLVSPQGGPTQVSCAIPLLLERGQSGVGDPA